MLIRQARKDDYEAINALNKELVSYHKEIRSDIFATHINPDYDYETFIDEINEDDKLWAVVEENGEILGTVFAYIRAVVGTHRFYCFIDLIIVKKGARGRGVGQMLFDFVEEFSRRNKIDTIELNVWEGNPAYEFYKKQGMETQRTVLKKELRESNELHREDERKVS